MKQERGKSSAVGDMLSERLYERIHQRPPCSCENNIYPTFDEISDGDPFELSGSYLVRENGLHSHVSRMMIDSFGNNTHDVLDSL